MDIDIDVANRMDLLEKIKHRKASLHGGKVHNTGIYVTEIPHNPLTNISTIDYNTAEQRGYFKIDILNVNIYEGIRDEEHLNKLMSREPIWELLEQSDFTDKLFHLNGHSNILKKLKPKTVEQLAAVLSIIRPAKKYLIDSDWDTIIQEVWKKPPTGGYYWKKSHAFSYAMVVIVHMNLLCEQLLTNDTNL